MSERSERGPSGPAAGDDLEARMLAEQRVMREGATVPPPDVHAGFVTFVGRPNVGKSTLLNRILGQKVSIVSDKPQTTRNQVRGVLNRAGAQVVFVDTPGIHKPKTTLGTRLNETATDAVTGVDAVCLLVDATMPLGKGDRFVASRVPRDAVVIVNKTDVAPPAEVLRQLTRAASLDLSEYFPLSAATGAGVDALVDHLVDRLPMGPPLYPPGVVTDVPEAFWVAELVREQLFAVMREEMPYSIATQVTDWEWPWIRCEILVERESQKGMVIGRKGAILKEVGKAVRAQLAEGAYLELVAKVDPGWQRRPRALTRLGY